jgi:UDP-3-O-[3-hydroxymyristoyl] glucosamine N-acyltransferase
VIDARFYALHGPIRVADLFGGATVRGDPERTVGSVAAYEAGADGDLVYFDAKGAAPPTGARVIILKESAASDALGDATLIFSGQPRALFARTAGRLATERVPDGAAGFIHPTAILEDGARLAPGAVIAQDARVGAGAVIGANAVIGPGVAIGRRTRIGAGVTIMCALVGDDVTILPGAMIGQSGFGVAGDEQGPVDVPHFGRAIIQDGASIGAGVTVDRGLFGDTVVGELAKIDNLCQIAHNVVVGRGAIIAAFGGISGSVKIGDGAMLGGRVGVADHRTVGRGAVLAAGSAVMHDVPAGETWAGYPAKPLRQWLREVAWLGKAIGKRDGGEG